MAKGSILRSKGADGCFHKFDSERMRNTGGETINKKIECMKDADICRTCDKEYCKGTEKCVEKRKRELEREKQNDNARG